MRDMDENLRTKYYADVIMCIDLTSDTLHCINQFNENAIRFYEYLNIRRI